jgi:ABC-2 type transport system ATP-binding protein
VSAAIEVAGVGKRYVKYHDQPMLAHALVRLAARSRHDHLWALRGVDLSVGEGECVGVIGRNGSGKSTLLQLLGGITAPTEGTVTVHGRVAPLISVGVGFHPELTGRDNVYLNGSILGMRRREIEDRFDEIVDFAEIGDFLDTPYKHNSSGMKVRLAFSVVSRLREPILLVDEVLAVGDAAFRKKCYARIDSLLQNGQTLFLVSHSAPNLRKFCKRGVYLEGGSLRADGPIDDVINMYEADTDTADEELRTDVGTVG